MRRKNMTTKVKKTVALFMATALVLGCGAQHVAVKADQTTAGSSAAATGTSVAVSASAKLSDARLTRQTARDEAVELLEDILKDDSAEVAVKQAAVDEAAVIAQNILKETNIESLIEAKGFTECVAYINGESCTVVVNGDMEDEQNALIVRDIAVSESGVSAENVKIISAAK
mgnify:CR=1 FL=1